MEKKGITFSKTTLLQILLAVYIIRLLFPQGIYSLTLTGLFYGFTVLFVIGGLAIAGIAGVIGILKSRINKTMVSPRHISFAITAITGLILFGISYYIHQTYFNKNFDPELWRNTSVSLDFDANLLTPRQRMMEDLVENNLMGLHKDEVVSLLGSPSESWEPMDGRGWILLYVVGPERGLGVDDQCLQINFDENETFESYQDIPICG